MGNGKRIIWIIVIVVLVIIGAAVWALSGSSSKKSNSGGGTAASASPTPVQTAYAGTNTLIDQGASNEQIDDLKFAIFKFTQSKSITPKNITITSARHIHGQTAAGAALDSITFNLDIDGNEYNANLIESGLTAAQIVLSDINTNAQVYDSGVVDVDNQ